MVPHTLLYLLQRSLARADLQLDGVEFSSLPSGLHLVEEDVVYVSHSSPCALVLPLWTRYFTKDGLRGVCIFTRRSTTEHGQRGFRLSSLGILLARSVRPRPWRHVPALKALVRELQSNSDSGQDIWAPARQFFELRKTRPADPGGAGAWHRWSEELDFDVDDSGAEGGGDEPLEVSSLPLFSCCLLSKTIHSR